MPATIAAIMVIAAAVISVHWLQPSPLNGPVGAELIAAFIVFVLAFFPTWLYVRFMRNRGPALWSEYCIYLHRLGVDRREHLPRPPEDSEYYSLWAAAVTTTRATKKAAHNIYRQKFDAYYGRKFVDSVERGGKDVKTTETLFPVLLCSAIFALGWASIFRADTGATLTDGLLAARPPGDILKFAFAGAYLFDVQMLLRRYFQRDLKASAYTSAIARVVTVLIIVVVLHQLAVFASGSPQSCEAVVAFIVGFFPLMGLQALQRTAAVILRVVVKSLRSDYPLSDLDGLNIWYEARLLEEGIEDQQELVTANIVEVVLSTRVPVGRLVDWLDQAHLNLHLSRRPLPDTPAQSSESGGRSRPTMREVLRSAGIRRATDLLIAFGAYQAEQGSGNAEARAGRRLAGWIAEQVGTNPQAVLSLVRVVGADTGLTPVLNWRHWGAQRLRELEEGTACDEPRQGQSLGWVTLVGRVISVAATGDGRDAVVGSLIAGVNGLTQTPDVLITEHSKGKTGRVIDPRHIQVAIDVLTPEEEADADQENQWIATRRVDCAKADIPYYWVIRPDAQEIVCYKRVGRGREYARLPPLGRGGPGECSLVEEPFRVSRGDLFGRTLPMPRMSNDDQLSNAPASN